MLSSTRDQINGYLTEMFSPELRDELLASFMVFDAYEHGTVEDELTDIFNDIDNDQDDLTKDKVFACISDNLTVILRKHNISLADDVSLHTKNQILAVLYRLQHVEDPVSPLRILESMETNEVKLSKIIEQYSDLPETVALESIEEVSESFIKRLMTLLYDIEEKLANATEEERSVDPELVSLKKNLKDFFTVHGKDSLGFDMVVNGIESGLPIKIYYPYIKDHLVEGDDDTVAKNLLSLFFMGKDTFSDPLQVFRKYSEQLITPIDRIIKIEVKLGELLNKLHQYQEAQSAAKSISVVQHQFSNLIAEKPGKPA